MTTHKPLYEPHSASTGIDIPCRAVVLHGALMIPANARGVVVFAHGSGSSRHSPRNQYVARTIRKSGYGTLFFDLLTAQEEVEDNVTRHLRFNVGLLAERLLEVTRWLVSQPEIQHLGIGYFGSSTGAAAALLAAAESEQPIDAVVSRGGRPDLAGGALFRVKSPTLLIVGGYDYQVLELNQKALERLQCEKQLRIVPGATHLFEEMGTLEAVASLAADWFHRYLR